MGEPWAKGEKWGLRETELNGYRVSVWNFEKVLQVKSVMVAQHCECYIILSNCMLKNG